MTSLRPWRLSPDTRECYGKDKVTVCDVDEEYAELLPNPGRDKLFHESHSSSKLTPDFALPVR